MDRKIFFSPIKISGIFTAVLCSLYPAFISTSLPARAAKNAPPEGEWIMRQSARDMGTVTAYVSHDAAKIDSPDAGYQIVCKGPDFKVHAFRPTEKLGWDGDLNLFTGVVLANPFAVLKFNSGVKKLEPTIVYQGVKCNQYIPTGIKDNIEFGAVDLPVDKRIAEFLCRYYFIVNIDQVPLFRKLLTRRVNLQLEQKGWLDVDVARDLRHTPTVLLSTESIKKTTFNAGDFNVPANLKRVRDINEVGYSPGKRGDFGELMTEFGDTSHLGSKRK